MALPRAGLLVGSTVLLFCCDVHRGQSPLGYPPAGSGAHDRCWLRRFDSRQGTARGCRFWIGRAGEPLEDAQLINGFRPGVAPPHRDLPRGGDHASLTALRIRSASAVVCPSVLCPRVGPVDQHNGGAGIKFLSLLLLQPCVLGPAEHHPSCDTRLAKARDKRRLAAQILGVGAGPVARFRRRPWSRRRAEVTATRNLRTEASEAEGTCRGCPRGHRGRSQSGAEGIGSSLKRGLVGRRAEVHGAWRVTGPNVLRAARLGE